MPIVADDLKFLSSERMSDVMLSSPDTSSSGGFAALPVVQTGTSNNVFPDVMPSDRLTGRLQARLVYPAILSNENSRGSNLQYAEVERPSDPNVDLVAFPASFQPVLVATLVGPPNPTVQVLSRSQQRNVFWAALAIEQGRANSALGGSALARLSAANASSLVNYPGGAPALVGLDVGDKIWIGIPEAPGVPGVTVADWRTVTAIDGLAGTIAFSGFVAFTDTTTLLTVRRYTGLPFQVSAPATLTAQLDPAGTVVAVDRLEARVHPVGSTDATPGFALAAQTLRPDAGSAFSRGGVVPIFDVGRKVLLQHPTVPATREVAVVSRVNYATGQVTLAAGVVNTYPIGTVISTLLDLGDAQAAVSLTPFFQQTWARAWSDTLSGLSIAARYNGGIGMNNAGGTDDRWSIVFTSATQFECHSERMGVIAIGNTASDFSPLNPATSQPYFTLFASGWTTGWLPNNCMRFNTRPSNAGVWRSRCVSPGPTSGSAQGQMAVRVDVDA